MQFLLLGPLVVADSAGAPVAIAGPRLRVLLAALLLHANIPVPADQLTETVWDGAPPSGATVTLRSYVRRLRRAMDPGGTRITASGPGYVIRVDQAELDILEFETLCQNARTALRAGQWPAASAAAGLALGLWRAAPLLDVPAEVLRGEFVPRLERLRLQALQDRFDAGLQLEQHQDLIPELQDATAQHPLQERFHAQLMLALASTGRRAQALDAYQEARRVLVSELGIEPGQELRDIHHQILTGDTVRVRERPAAAADSAGPPADGHLTVIPRMLPGGVPHFTGRSAELAALSEILGRAESQAPGTVVISAIGGTAGVGKTALAAHWAHQIAARFCDGQLYVNLRGFDQSGVPVTPAEAIRGFLDALGVPPARIPQDLPALTGLYRSLLADRQMLIVLDNARDEQQVRPLLPAQSGCLVIVTSRNQLTGLAAGEGARLLSLDVLSQPDARQMLRTRLGYARADAEPDAIGEIARLCAGLPLALAIAAAHGAARPRLRLSDLAAVIRDTYSRLDALETGDPTMSVRAVFTWSVRQLRPDAARMFRLLGLHPGPDISVPAAASLAGVTPLAAGRALRELTEKSLLTEHQPGRYTFHDLLRAYAAEQADDDSDSTDSTDDDTRPAAVGRLLDHYLHTAYAAATLLNPVQRPIAIAPARPGVTPEVVEDDQQALTWFETEHQVLLAAVRLAAETGADTCAWQLARNLADYLNRRACWQDLLTVEHTALAAATRAGDLAAQATMKRGLGYTHDCLGNYAQASIELAGALDLCQQLGDLVGQASVHQTLCHMHEGQGRFAAALGHAQQALGLYEATDDKANQAAALGNIGWLRALLGDHQEARADCQQAVALFRELGLRNREAAVLDSLGFAEHKLGNFPEAASCYQQSLAIFRESGSRWLEAVILTHLGDNSQAAGDAEQAHESWRDALVIYEELDHRDADEVREKLRQLNADP
jgi:DNA-binding SARP family transcriptional activator